MTINSKKCVKKSKRLPPKILAISDAGGLFGSLLFIRLKIVLSFELQVSRSGR